MIESDQIKIKKDKIVNFMEYTSFSPSFPTELRGQILVENFQPPPALLFTIPNKGKLPFPPNQINPNKINLPPTLIPCQ